MAMVQFIEVEAHAGDSTNIISRRIYDTLAIDRIKKKLGTTTKSIICRTIIESKYRDIILKKTIDMKTLEETIECAREVMTVRRIEPKYILIDVVSERCDIVEIPPTNDIQYCEYCEEVVTISGLSFHFKQMDRNKKKYILDIFFEESSDRNIDMIISHLCIDDSP